MPTCGASRAKITNSVNEALKEREIQAKYVELAVSILRDRPTPESEPLRRWAISIVGNYTDTPIPVETKETLLKYRLPWANTGTWDTIATWGAFEKRAKEVGPERAFKEFTEQQRERRRELMEELLELRSK